MGNWKQINANLCCNDITTTLPPSTTTTTTAPLYTHSIFVSMNNQNACNLFNGSSFTVYTNAPFASGVTLYTDAALTQEFPAAIYGGHINENGIVYTVSGPLGQYLADNGTSCSLYTTTTTTTSQVLYPISVYTQGGSSTSQLCPPGSEGTSGTSTMYSTTPVVVIGSVVYYDSNGTNPVGGGGFNRKQVGQSLVWTCPYYNGVVSEIPC